MVRELNTVDEVNIKAMQLEWKDGAFIADISMDHVRLDGEDAPRHCSRTLVGLHSVAYKNVTLLRIRTLITPHHHANTAVLEPLVWSHINPVLSIWLMMRRTVVMLSWLALKKLVLEAVVTKDLVIRYASLQSSTQAGKCCAIVWGAGVLSGCGASSN